MGNRFITVELRPNTITGQLYAVPDSITTWPGLDEAITGVGNVAIVVPCEPGDWAQYVLFDPAARRGDPSPEVMWVAVRFKPEHQRAVDFMENAAEWVRGFLMKENGS